MIFFGWVSLGLGMSVAPLLGGIPGAFELLVILGIIFVPMLLAAYYFGKDRERSQPPESDDEGM
jgi:hypothetical protein